MTKSQTIPQHYLGMMSGTSVDGIDIALVEITAGRCKLLESGCYPIEQSIKEDIHSLCSPQEINHYTDYQPGLADSLENRIEKMAKIDHQLGVIYAGVVNQFICDKNIVKENIKAIGNHGQTIRHRPSGKYPFTLQIGDANIIAHRTGLTTVSDFRRMDMATGGQGAPLVPAFHESLMRCTSENRVILNLGGIANITFLPKLFKQSKAEQVIGFDTGPANTLLDAHFKKHHKDLGFDRDGVFAQKGIVDQNLLSRLLTDDYFKQPAPKSTGREYFSIGWLQKELARLDYAITPEAIQATLLELTTQTITNSINDLDVDDFEIYACGGGMHNQHLLNQLSKKLGKEIFTTNDLGINGDSLEAMTFAWLAHRRIEGLTGNLPSVTGAKEAKVLGAIYHA